MNWCDLAVIAIILGFALYGMFKGFIMSVFKLLSFIISLALSFLMYPYVSKFLMGTVLHDKIKTAIFDNLISQQGGALTQTKDAVAQKVVDSLNIPGFLKDVLITKFPDPSRLLNFNDIINTVSEELTKIAIYIISLIILYVLVRVILIFSKYTLGGLSKLPVLKQVDKIGGFALGAIEGFLTVYIIFTLMMIFSASPSFKGIFEAIDNSTIADVIFEHNFIFNLLSVKK
ncbi:MAG: CvpA family protein [Bacillota bacterium]|nr:CvpA family protein [Bacillota bacterium]